LPSKPPPISLQIGTNMKRSKQSKEEHEKTCFRCRLHALVEELYPNGVTDSSEGRFILVALAEAAGQMLADYDVQEFVIFMTAVSKFHNDKCEEDSSETKH
jgi:hypothetical protein